MEHKTEIETPPLAKAKELMAGNLLTRSDRSKMRWQEVQIDAEEIQYIQENEDNSKAYTLYRYIPLTEDGVIKLGFEKFGKIGYRLPDFKEIVIGFSEIYGWGIMGWSFQPPLKYVHQLQNLFQSFGIELKPKT